MPVLSYERIFKNPYDYPKKLVIIRNLFRNNFQPWVVQFIHSLELKNNKKSQQKSCNKASNFKRNQVSNGGNGYSMVQPFKEVF